MNNRLPPPNGRDINGEILAELRNLVAYQPTTFEQGAGGRTRASEIETTVNDILGEVLGTQIRADDVRSLQASLENVFTFERIDGHRVVRWQRPNYALQTDLGATLTGARASFYSYALTQADEMRKRIRALRSPTSHADDDRMAAAREGWLIELDDLMDTLGRGTALRPIQIDSAFDRLRAYSEAAEGAFGVDADNYDQNVQSPEDARIVSEFQTALRFQDGIEDAWADYKEAADLGDGDFVPFPVQDANNQVADAVEVPMRLMQLKPLLSALWANIQHDLYGGLDALAFSVEDRSVTELTYTIAGDIPQYISVAELFDWATRLSGSKALRLLKNAARVGLPSFRAEAQLLHLLITELPNANPPEVSSHPRITNALSTIADLLEHIDREVQP